MVDQATQIVDISVEIAKAAAVIQSGGVIAYPTESCFGLGCDPMCRAAVHRILTIKNRQAAKGLILIAANIAQIEQYADLRSAKMLDSILDSWPGPNTWLLPKRQSVPEWLSGEHQSIAMRVTGHAASNKLCEQFGGAIVSTSANRAGRNALTTTNEVKMEMATELDFILDIEIGAIGAPSTIRDGDTGVQIR